VISKEEMVVNAFPNVVQPCAIVSVTLSISVVVTVLLFPDMIRSKIFVKIVALISACDAMGNWPYALSKYPANGTALCRFEGFCNLYFFPCSWILTTFLMKLFRDLVVSCKIWISFRTVVFVSMGLPLLFTLLQLTGGTYGNEDDKEEQPCNFGGDLKFSSTWHLVTYDGLLFLCLATMMVYLLEVLWIQYNNGVKAKNTLVYVFMRQVLILYPVAMFVCWMPHAVCLFVPECNNNLDTEGDIVAVKILHGGCVAVIFYSMSNEGRRRWMELFEGLLHSIGLIQRPTQPTNGPSLWGTTTGNTLNDSLCDHVILDGLPDDDQLTTMLMIDSEVHFGDSLSTGIAITDASSRPSVLPPKSSFR
jgi:hypothetical protein